MLPLGHLGASPGRVLAKWRCSWRRQFLVVCIPAPGFTIGALEMWGLTCTPGPSAYAAYRAR
eukprot:9477954-Pyramimonas_sp.AAC.1